MTYSPQSTNKKEKALSITMAILAVILFGASGIVDKFSGLYQISAFVLAILSIQIYLKYVFSKYIYKATDSSLEVYRISGKKSICVCSLDYEMSLSTIVSSESYKNNKSEYPKTNFNVNYCKNLAPDNYYVYFFEFNGKRSMMKFEPDAAFAEYVSELISQAVNDEDDIYDD